MWTLVSICLGVWLVAENKAYNVDVRSADIFYDPRGESSGSYFGFTVALQKTPKRVLIGAPRSNSSQVNYKWIHEPGLTYECDLDLAAQCRPIFLEDGGNQDLGDYSDRKDEGWLGGAIEAEENSSTLVTCGSRWTNSKYSNNYYLMNGVCYVTEKKTLNGEKLLPLINETQQKYTLAENKKSKDLFYYAYGQAGFSAHLTPASELIIGAPGVLEWTGTVIKYQKNTSKRYSDLLVPNPIFTKDLTRNGYLGYAVTSGKFNHKERLYVASAPRGALHVGQVLLFLFPDAQDKPLDIHLQLRGFQMGEYFGACLAVADVDADGLDDLLVGAPLYSTAKAGDSGAVYLFLSTQMWNSQLPLRLTGSWEPGARFGTAIGALADLDQDGFNDVAVGAPYEKHGESEGAVYIYRGGKLGLMDTPSQRILSSDFSLPISGFGISLSRALDVDNNFYPDFAVGAHDSGHVVLVKTSPLVRVKTRIIRSVRNLSLNTTRIIFEACVEYNGNHLNSNMKLNATVIVDPIHLRGSFQSGGNVAKLELNLRRGVETCKALIVTLTPRSTWTGAAAYGALPVTMTTAITPSPCVVCPTLDLTSNTVVLDKIQVMDTCDKDECIPVWKLSAHYPNVSRPFVLGSSDTIPLTVMISNEGDSARVMEVTVDFPQNVNRRSVPPACDASKSSQLICFKSSLISTGEMQSFTVNVDVSKFDAPLLEVNVSARSYDSDKVSAASAVLHAVKLLRMRVDGRAAPSIAVLPRGTEAKAKTFSVTHHYHLYCDGYTPIEQALLTVILPVRALIGQEWHSLLNFTYTASNGEARVTCSIQLPSDRTRREAKQTNERDLSCGKTNGEVECRQIVCEAEKPLLPKSSGLTLSVKMDVSMFVTGVLLTKVNEILLNTSGIAEIRGSAESPVVLGVSTILAGPVPQKEDRFYPLYIAAGVVLAIIILVLIVTALYKCGFFKRQQKGDVKEEESALGEYSDQENDGGEVHDVR